MKKSKQRRDSPYVGEFVHEVSGPDNNVNNTMHASLDANKWARQLSKGFAPGKRLEMSQIALVDP